MAGVTLNPYLNFEGNCAEAMNFYQSVFGGNLEISRFSDFPNPSLTEEYKDKVMHGVLKSETITVMASDGMPGKKVVFGDSVNCSLAGEDGLSLTKFFNGLSEGGNVTIPLEKQVWGDLHDKNKEPGRIMFVLQSDNVKEDFDRIKSQGAEIVAEPYQPNKDDQADVWLATFADPDGNYFQLATPWKKDSK
jgi:PhnB protein